VLAQIVYAGAQAPSFARAAQDLWHLAGQRCSVKSVERLTRQIGAERVAERTAAIDAWRQRRLIDKHPVPEGVAPPTVAVVEMDGGRLQIRTPPQTTTADEPPPTPAASAPAAPAPAAPAPRPRHWREDKVGCLLSMTSTATAVDPCPEIPALFVSAERALLLVQGFGPCAVPEGEAPAATETAAAPGPRPGRPEPLVRTVVARRQDVEGFGPQLARAAWDRGFFGAARQAFLGDGAAANWTVWRRWFPHFVPIVDFLHVLSYVFAAAMAGRSFAAGWPVYRRWIEALWAGDVAVVQEGLAARQVEVGLPAPDAGATSPAQVIQDAVTYLANHHDKMHYADYRRQGLPLMSSHVESVIKQINYRVKGTEKFWSEGGAEAILQLRADYLSDTEPLADFWQRRQAAMTGQRRYRRAA
jgi:hypothetical protein